MEEHECRKNQRHDQFISTSEFKPIHLPERFRSQLVWALIYHKARLTVKLIVNHVSHRRPVEFLEEYGIRITGSGYVTDIDRSHPGCVTITIDTAAHVVYDDDEAASTIAKFYFHCNKEVFQIKQARLLTVNKRKDRSRITFTIDLETLQRLASPGGLAALEYARHPSILPDVNRNMNISLLQSVISRYTALSFPWLSFLFSELKCLRNIKFFSNKTRLLEIEIQISHILLYDIILLIIALASHRDSLMQVMEDIVCRSEVQRGVMKIPQGPYVTLSKEETNGDNVVIKSTSELFLNTFNDMDNKPLSLINNEFRIHGYETLHQLMTCFIASPIEIRKLNSALNKFCQFDISARLKPKNLGVIVFEIPVTSVNTADKMSLEVNLHDIEIKEGPDNIAVLIGHPHGMPQKITVGELLNHLPDSHEVTYTTPSCPGSSGGPVLIIPREPTSLEDLENINVITHSCASSKMGFGNRV